MSAALNGIASMIAFWILHSAGSIAPLTTLSCNERLASARITMPASITPSTSDYQLQLDFFFLNAPLSCTVEFWSFVICRRCGDCVCSDNFQVANVVSPSAPKTLHKTKLSCIRGPWCDLKSRAIKQHGLAVKSISPIHPSILPSIHPLLRPMWLPQLQAECARGPLQSEAFMQQQQI